MLFAADFATSPLRPLADASGYGSSGLAQASSLPIAIPARHAKSSLFMPLLLDDYDGK